MNRRLFSQKAEDFSHSFVKIFQMSNIDCQNVVMHLWWNQRKKYDWLQIFFLPNLTIFEIFSKTSTNPECRWLDVETNRKWAIEHLGKVQLIYMDLFLSSHTHTRSTASKSDSLSTNLARNWKPCCLKLKILATRMESCTMSFIVIITVQIFIINNGS